VYHQPEIETMDRTALEELQLERLKASVLYCYEHIGFYRTSFDEAGIDPHEIHALDDLQKFPFTVKQDLRDHYPFGLWAVDARDAVRVHASSGTTGQATVVGYTVRDLDIWGECLARDIAYTGHDEHAIVQVAYGYGLFTGGLGADGGAQMRGCLTIPMSSGNTKRQIQIMKDFETDILCCTPSYALNIADKAIEMGYNPPRDFKLSAGILGAEPCSDNMRREIEEKLGIQVYDIYGLSEVMGPGVACECKEQHGLHVAEDHFLIEILDPETLEPVPDGQWGEIVLTSLDREASPLIRYRTRDISRILPGTCPCGVTHRRMDRLQGRTDDMLIIRGVNVFPSQIEQVITQLDEVTTHYQIVLTTVGPLDHVELQIETVPEFEFDEIRQVERLKKRLAGELKSNLQIKVDIKLVEPLTIARSEGKAKRVIDNRTVKNAWEGR
jgi:phenylacetate-CoA ligase